MIWDAILLEINCRIMAYTLKHYTYAVQIMKLWIQVLDSSKYLQNKDVVPSLIHLNVQ